MGRFTLNSRLLSLILYGYYRDIPIIEAAVKKENRLDMIMELHNTSNPKFNIYRYNQHNIQFLYKMGILDIFTEKNYLTKTGEEIAKKLKEEINMYNKQGIDYKNLNIDKILKILCRELIVDKDSNKYVFYPIFQVVYENYNKPVLTPKLIGKYGIMLLALYNEENNCYKCKNWSLSLKNIKNYLYELSIDCHNKFGNKINAKQLELYNLVTPRGNKANIRYKLTENGYNVAKYILKNLAIVYKYLE